MTQVSFATGDVREIHREVGNAGAVFQVASQFNLFEDGGSRMTPEDGVTGYERDGTQGPACAIAAGAATIYRNYFVPVGGHWQRTGAQIDCLADLGQALGLEADRLWTMRNGYALCTPQGLHEIERHLEGLTDEALDSLRGQLRIGLHWQVDVTDRPAPGHRVSQAFCSALPVAYSQIAVRHWARFAQLVLESAYEATLLAALF